MPLSCIYVLVYVVPIHIRRMQKDFQLYTHFGFYGCCENHGAVFTPPKAWNAIGGMTDGSMKIKHQRFVSFPRNNTWRARGELDLFRRIWGNVLCILSCCQDGKPVRGDQSHYL